MVKSQNLPVCDVLEFTVEDDESSAAFFLFVSFISHPKKVILTLFLQ